MLEIFIDFLNMLFNITDRVSSDSLADFLLAPYIIWTLIANTKKAFYDGFWSVSVPADNQSLLL